MSGCSVVLKKKLKRVKGVGHLNFSLNETNEK